MTASRRIGFALLALLGAGPALAQTTAPGSLPPPVRPGAPAAPAAPSAPAPPRQAVPAPTPRAGTPAPPTPRQASPTQATPRTPATAQRPPAAAPVVRAPTRPDGRPPGATARQGQSGQRGRAAAGAAAGAAGAAGAAAGATRPAEPAPAPAPPPEPQPSVGAVTNLPLPRFAALRSDEVNLRAGPGTRFPIEWTYQRRELPVEITREFELWRRIRDPDGTEGWVHQSTLMGRRSAIVRGAPNSETALRRRPEADSPPVARLRPGVVVRLRQCEPRSPWCEAQAGEYRGYILRSEVWGVSADEEVK